MDEPNILIKTALSDAVQKVNEGMSPTDALKKVANDLDLNPNYIQRTGEALNVALHYKHFKTASDRSTDFEIADIPKAVEETFMVSEKTAAEYVSDHFSSSEANDTVFNYNRILSNPVYKRAFMEINDAPENFESFPTTLTTVYEKSANHIRKMSKIAEEATVAKVAAELELNGQFSSLSDEFKKDAGYRTSFDEFESQVFAKHGEAALPYVDLLYKASNCKEERGVHDSKYMMFDQCKEAQMFDDLMLAASSFISTEKQAAEAQENLSFESAFMKECRTFMGKQSAAKCSGCGCSLAAGKKECSCASDESSKECASEDEEPSDPVLAEIKKKASDANYVVGGSYDKDPVMEKAAFGGLGGFGKLVSELVEAPITDAFKHSIKPAPSKPNLTLDNMERKLLLQELMMTDPILSKVNPVKVARAFEQLLRLSPEISKEKEVVRAELRAMVASQALSKFDADLMTKLDVGMLKRRAATHEFNAGHIENFRF